MALLILIVILLIAGLWGTLRVSRILKKRKKADQLFPPKPEKHIPHRPVWRLVAALFLLIIAAYVSLVLVVLSTSNYRRSEYQQKAPTLFMVDFFAIGALVFTLLPWIRTKGTKPSSEKVPGTIRGKVRNLQVSFDGPDRRSTRSIWRFELVPEASEGAETFAQVVEMKGWWLDGALSDGDMLEVVPHGAGPGAPIRTEEVFSVTANGAIKAMQSVRGTIAKLNQLDEINQGKSRANTFSPQTSHSTNVTQRVWTFRMERFDDQGNALLPAVVQMRGISLSGDLSDGDEVEIEGWIPGEILNARQIFNRTTRIFVHIKW